MENSNTALVLARPNQQIIRRERQQEMSQADLCKYSIIAQEYERNPILELPIDALTIWQQQIISELQNIFRCSRDFVVSSIFGAVSGAIGSKVSCYDGKYTNSPCLWLVNVAQSGQNKSQPMLWAIKPIENWDNSNYNAYIKACENLRQNPLSYIEIPKLVQHIISDSTPEARNDLLAKNPQGLLLCRDEIRGFLDDIDRYSKSGEISQLLSIFDGTDFTTNRKKDGLTYIRKPFMSILGSIQPGILKDTFGKQVLMNNGFTPRWLWVYPDNFTLPQLYSDVKISEEINNIWSNFLGILMASTFHRPASFQLTAIRMYEDYWNYLQYMKFKHEYMAPVYSKLQIYAQRLALLVETMIGNDISNMVISSLSMEYAIRLCRYFEHTANKVHTIITNSLTENVVGREAILRMLDKAYIIKSQSKLAESLGITKQAVNKALRK